jgi:hypothetical protein
MKKKYGLGRLFLDVFLTVITGGAWLIVLLIIFLRRNSR